jgi:L-aspartate oxidase
MKSRRLPLDLERHLAPFEAQRLPFYRFDVVVLGTGVAGSSAALAAARAGVTVAVVAKDQAVETNTYYAQGGVAAVLDSEDSFEAHVADTLNVGCGLSEPAVVDEIVRGGPRSIERRIEWGASFDRLPDGSLDLAREGGPSQKRIVHSHGAATGIEIQRTLTRAVVDSGEVVLFEHTFASTS